MEKRPPIVRNTINHISPSHSQTQSNFYRSSAATITSQVTSPSQNPTNGNINNNDNNLQKSNHEFYNQCLNLLLDSNRNKSLKILSDLVQKSKPQNDILRKSQKSDVSFRSSFSSNNSHIVNMNKHYKGLSKHRDESIGRNKYGTRPTPAISFKQSKMKQIKLI